MATSLPASKHRVLHPMMSPHADLIDLLCCLIFGIASIGGWLLLGI
jgi:hypothetical protein